MLTSRPTNRFENQKHATGAAVVDRRKVNRSRRILFGNPEKVPGILSSPERSIRRRPSYTTSVQTMIPANSTG